VILNKIGKLIKIYADKIFIEIPDLSILNFNYSGDSYYCSGINEYITILDINSTKYLYQIVGLSENEFPYDKDVENSKFFQKSVFDAVPIGQFNNDKFTFGLKKFPMLQDGVYLATKEDISRIFNANGFSISLGNLTSKNFAPKFSIDSLFANHNAILGNTGSGKSTTIRKILGTLNKKITGSYSKGKVNFIIFDVHNEYSKFCKEDTECIKGIEYVHIPLEMLSEQDWVNLVRPSELVQRPVLLDAIRLGALLESDTSTSSWIRVYCAYVMYKYVQTDPVSKRTKIVGLLQRVNDPKINTQLLNYNSQYANLPQGMEPAFEKSMIDFITTKIDIAIDMIDNHLNFLLSNINPQIKSFSVFHEALDLVFLLEEMKGNSQARSHCGTLITRIKSLQHKYEKTIFKSIDARDDKSKNNKLSELLNSTKKMFTVFDLSGFDDEDLLFIVSFIVERIFKQQKNTKTQAGNVEKIYNFILDEAHRYITSNVKEMPEGALLAFERVAKEGRKFGCYLILSSQRPNELASSVLSQCNNYLFHRVRNNLDLDYIRKSVPYITENQVRRLSYLQTGVILAVGDAFVIPCEISVDAEHYGNITKSPCPSEHWKQK
jgi:DNA helicase HerA-like ATPase